ncbi:MAG: hypothetical protein MRQ07_03255 [Candidatus Midichloria sp.]|nr:hypothetical protein [Candidatus Midichloria sp.]
MANYSSKYGKNIEQFHGCMSISDIMARLYARAERWVSIIASILVTITIIASQAKATSLILNYFFQVPIVLSIVISTLIIASYSAFSGVRLINYTDVFQFIIIIEEMLTPDINTENIVLFFSLILFSLLPKTRTPYVQRFLIISGRQLYLSLLLLDF